MRQKNILSQFSENKPSLTTQEAALEVKRATSQTQWVFSFDSKGLLPWKKKKKTKMKALISGDGVDEITLGRSS